MSNSRKRQHRCNTTSPAIYEEPSLTYQRSLGHLSGSGTCWPQEYRMAQLGLWILSYVDYTEIVLDSEIYTSLDRALQEFACGLEATDQNVWVLGCNLQATRKEGPRENTSWLRGGCPIVARTTLGCRAYDYSSSLRAVGQGVPDEYDSLVNVWSLTGCVTSNFGNIEGCGEG